jgi:8-oxo-dGTP pyrophosphatase MutT (NUDIX family)
MKSEYSAGGIVIRKLRRIWYVLLIRDMNKFLTFPKGHIEKGESKIDTATREVYEEVGLSKIRYIKTLHPVQYWYRKKRLIQKTVYYFLFELSSYQQTHCQKSEGITESCWKPLKTVLSIIGYADTNKPLIREVIRYLHI